MSLAQTAGDELRHEVKFVTYATEYRGVLDWLRRHAEGFVSPYPARQINNVYFDTVDQRAYAENLAGVSRRAKLRYRWYGDSVGPAAGVLEVKHKRNQLGWKQRFRVERAPWHAAGDTWRDVIGRLRAELPPAGRHWLDQFPQAASVNRYWRQYFVSADGRLRATLDQHQQCFDQRRGLAPNFTSRGIIEDLIVLELKFAREDRALAEAALQRVPMRLGRHSKYMNAIRATSYV